MRIYGFFSGDRQETGRVSAGVSALHGPDHKKRVRQDQTQRAPRGRLVRIPPRRVPVSRKQRPVGVEPTGRTDTSRDRKSLPRRLILSHCEADFKELFKMLGRIVDRRQAIE